MAFKEGTSIKGKDLKGHLLCKILSEDMFIKTFQYHMGENVDIYPLVIKDRCEAGIQFTDEKNVISFLSFCTKLAVIEVPESADVYVDYERYETHKLIVKKIMSLSEVSTWNYLIENGVDITSCNNFVVRWAAENGHLEVVQYLHEQGADITAQNNLSLRLASKNGHLGVVKYLYEHEVDITAEDNLAVRLASENRQLEVVKYCC